MQKLPTIISELLAANDESEEAFAKRSGVGLGTLQGILNKGQLPRKPEHRENLRVVLGYEADEWSNILLYTNGLVDDEDDLNHPNLQVLLARELFRQGLTEQGLARLAKVPYPTALGLVRKGSIPRNDSLNRLGDILGLEPEAVAAATERSKTIRDAAEAEEGEAMSVATEGLAQLVAREIRDRGQTIGAFAESIGIGYITLSRFLSSGQPPKRASALNPLKEALNLDDEHFTAAITRSHSNPEPGTVQVRAGEPPPDANPLQVALMRFMHDRKLTIKSLAQQAGLSQITVSRLVKQGSLPSRTRTHRKLQSLLDLDDQSYSQLTSTKPAGASKPEGAAKVQTEALEAKEDLQTSSTALERSGDEDEYQTTDDLTITDVELQRLLKRLNKQQRATLTSFLRTLLGN